MNSIEERLAKLTPEQRQFVLAKLTGKQSLSATSSSLTIEKIDRTGHIPLSFAQQRLWFLDKLENGAAYLYNEFSAHIITGPLNLSAFEKSLVAIVNRHEVLISVFPEANGIPYQRVQAQIVLLHIQPIDLQHLSHQEQHNRIRRLALKESQTPFDLVNGPLYRFKLFRLAETVHVFFMCMHHIVCDNWSGNIFRREIVLLYQAFADNNISPLADLPIQYADYSVWQRQWLTPEREDKQFNYWQKKLADAPALLNLPTDKPRPSVQTTNGARLQVQLNAELTQQLKQLSQLSGATLFMTLLTGFACLLNRYSHQETLVIGSPVANRQQRETEDLIGFFINTLMFRVDLNDTLTVNELLAQVKQTALEAYSRQDIPFERLVERLQPERSLSHAPLFQTMLVLHNAPESTQTVAGLTFEPLTIEQTSAMFDVTLLTHETVDGLHCEWEYNTDLFHPDTITRMAQHWQCLLEGFINYPDCPAAQLPLLTSAETAQLIAWNQSQQDYPEHITFVDLFEEQVIQAPNHIAVVFEQCSLSYQQLNQRANQLAHYLQAQGVQPETLVAIGVERSLDMIIGLLAILKAGGAYVPLDPGYPNARLTYLLQDSQAKLLLTQSHLTWSDSVVQIIYLDKLAEQLTHYPTSNPNHNLTADNLAYVIYTSGSTGNPKGVCISHQALCNHTQWMQANYPLNKSDKVLQKTAISFDASVWELFTPLVTGAELVLMPEWQKDISILIQAINHHQITILQTVPSLLNAILASSDQPLPSLKRLFCGGEILSLPLLKKALQQIDAEIINLYGPTEATIDATHWRYTTMWQLPFTSIGRPIANTQIYILGKHLQMQPIGIPGELHIGGAGLARGYLNRPELTAEKFIASPFSADPNVRLYKTGDLARWLPDGNLEYLGRIDNQIKLRGFRIELGEIEALLAQHEAVKEAVVIHYDAGINNRLIAYITLRDSMEAPDGLSITLRDWLKTCLPDYMLPSGFTILEALPLTPSGKINRNALPKPDLQLETEQQTARDETERLLLGLCSQLLSVELTSTQTDFFAAGGHSLLAMQLVARIRYSFNIEIPLRAVFKYPKLQDLAQYLTQQQGHPVLPAIVPKTDDEPLVLSFAQQRLWFLDQLEGGSATYHIPALLQLEGILHQTALQQALTDLVARHQSLRLYFPEHEGQPCVKVLESYNPLTQLDLGHLSVAEQQQHIHILTTEFINKPFQLSSGPLLRLQLVTLSDARHLLLFNIHHIIADGWSMDLLLKEWVVLYQAYCQKQPATLPKLSIQYTDYAAWQCHWLSGEILAQQLAYWRTKLADAPDFLELPTDFPRPPVLRFNGRIATFTLDPTLAEALKAFSRQSSSTLYMLLLSAYAVLLSRYSSATDIVIGSPVSNRNNLETEALIGLFVNTLTLRIDLSCQPDFNTLLKRVRQTSLEAYSHQDIPFEHIVEALRPARHLDRTPLYQVMFGLQTAQAAIMEPNDLRITPLELETQTARCDLTLLMNETDRRLDGVIEYSTDLFHVDTINRFINHFTTLLGDIVKQPEQRIDRLQLLDNDELKQLQAWNNTRAPYPEVASIQQVFASQVEQAPGAIALVFNDSQLSYRELNAQANRLAHYLMSLDVRPDQLIGVYLERSPELIISLLAILKAGGAYLALDAAYPTETLAFMLDEAGVTLLISQQSLLHQLPEQAAQIICIDALVTDRRLAARPDANPDTAVNGEHLAYVSYTSGSTGKPKGVCIVQKAVLRLVKNNPYMDFSPERTFLFFAPLAFDASTLEIWGALLNGARLVIMPPDAASLETLGRVIKTQGVDTLWLTSGLFNQMVDERLDDLSGIRQLLAGGDVLSAAHVKNALAGLKNAHLINGYGPTENTTFTCCFAISEADCNGGIPIGRPIANTQAYILDEHLQPLPIGIAGELYAGGDGLARGYLKQPALTAEKFIDAELFGNKQRLYRTGDRARYRSDGVIEFLGRLDNQIKLRGFRIELDAITAVLNQYPAIQESAVIVKPLTATDKRLLAYIVVKADAHFDEAACRAYLKQLLPDYMLPSALVPLDRLPLTANGKIDRNALPDAPQMPSDSSAAPRNAVEEILHGLWCDILHLDTLGVDADFFDCGGHSLLATQLISRIRRHFTIELPLRALFEAPTIRALAAQIEGARGQSAIQKPPITPVEQSTPELSFAQERLWFLDQLEPNNPFYNVPLALRLIGRLNIAALEQSLAHIIDRHAVLRTTFAKINGKPIPAIATTLPASPLLAVIDCDETQVETRVSEEAQKTFDLTHDALVRATLLRLSEQEHVLMLTLHHIVADGWSLGVLIDELLALYPALINQQPPTLSPLPIQYTDFAHWQRQWLTGDVLETQFNFWRQQLEGAPPVLNLPTDKQRPAVQSFRGSSELFPISADTTQALKALTRQHGATLFMTLFSAFAALLYRYSDQDDIVIGAPIANRNHAEIEPLIGFFVNTLALRVKLNERLSFTELLAQVRQTALDAYSHQDLPFEKLVDSLKIERDLSRNPLFQVMFALQNAPLEQLTLPDLAVTPIFTKRRSALFDMVLDFWEDGQQLTGVLEYNTDLFETATILSFIEHFKNLIQAITEKPLCPLRQLPLLDASETGRILNMGEGANISYPVHKPLHELFEQQVLQTPASIAAVHRHASGETTEIDYAELNQRANQIAHALLQIGVQPGAFVGILEMRGLDCLGAMLGIMKAGAAFLPIDPCYPDDRIHYMIANSQIKVLIARDIFAEKIAAMQEDTALTHIISFDKPFNNIALPVLSGDALARQPLTNPPPVNQPTDTAYILYTSGSTGLPKGAMVRHNGAVNHIHAEFDALKFHQGSAFLQSAPSSSDISVWQFLAPLLIGGRTVIIDFESVCDATRLFQVIREQAVTLIELVPVVLQSLLDYTATLPTRERQLPALECSMVTGEAVSVALVNQWLNTYPDIPLINAYGPTEAADDICQTMLDQPLPAGQINVPIGKPLANLNLYVLDKLQQLTPLGAHGEICVSGIGVGGGYWCNPDKTADSFVPNPYLERYDSHHSVIYRTGDLGRWLPDGSLEFIGRLDQQVKIRGFRIELGEIEGVLSQYPAVRENVVIVREDRSDDKQLAAYLVAAMQGEALQDDIEHLHKEQVALWQDLHEDSYSDAPSHADPTFNIIGWDSTCTGKQLPDADMREYVEHTIAAILALHPHAILEIGCGTGLLMYRLVPHCSSYTGTDLSSIALQRLENSKAQLSIQGLQQARFLTQNADDFTGFAENSYDTVVINSVVQYFPSIDYLVTVITGLLKLVRPGGAIFIGDVRDFTLLKTYYTFVQLYKADAGVTALELQQRIRQQSLQEQEMAIAPAFFSALKECFPQIGTVKIQPKRGLIRNEMSCFRYDVVLHLDGAETVKPAAFVWRDWQQQPLTIEAIRALLSLEQPPYLALRAVNNARVAAELNALAWLAEADDKANIAALKANAGDDNQANTGRLVSIDLALDPEIVWRLSQELPYDVHIGFTLDHTVPAGCFNAIFTHRKTPFTAQEISAALFPNTAANAAPKWSQYANNPLHEKFARTLIPRLRHFLKAKLPEHMIPAHFVVIDQLPLLPNGKINRAALPAPDLWQQKLDLSYTSPSTALEVKLTDIWRTVLGLEKIGIHDNFFELGGHSLKATQVISRIYKELGVEVSLRELFGQPTITELADIICSRQPAYYQAIPAIADAEHYPLSHAQKRLWILTQIGEGSSSAYQMSEALILEGTLDMVAFVGAFNALSVRHEALRTTFTIVDGEPRQKVHAQLPAAIEIIDLTGEPDPLSRAQQLALTDSKQGVDLTTGPLLRIGLLKLAEQRHVVLFNMHHIISDGWSMNILEQDFLQYYQALAKKTHTEATLNSLLPPLPIQYRDYAVWQNQLLQSEEAAHLQRYWLMQLASELPVLNLPTDFPRPPVKTYRGATYSFEFSTAQYQGLTALSHEHDVSLFMTLTALVNVLFYRYSQQQDIIIGTPVAGREQFELEAQIGFYVSTLVLRTRLDGALSFNALLAETKQTMLAAYEHQLYPFDRLVQELNLPRDVSRSPLFDVMLVMQNIDQHSQQFDAILVKPLPVEYGSSQFDMTLSFEAHDGGLRATIWYNTDLFLPARIERLSLHLQTLTGSILTDSTTALAHLPLLPEAEKNRVLLEFNSSEPFTAPTETLVSRFEQQVARTPDAIAVCFESKRLSYRELNAWANRSAHRLIDTGVAANDYVGLCVERSLDIVTGILAILKAGAAYVPLDPSYPQERLAFMLEDAGLKCVLTQPRTWAQMAFAATQAVYLDCEQPVESDEQTYNCTNPSLTIKPADIAYIIYTSGSTGKPKGALIPHANVIRLFTATDAWFGFNSRDVWTLFHSYAFDFSVWELWGALLYGGRLVVVPYLTSRSPEAFYQLLCAEQVTVLNQTPSAFRQLIEADKTAATTGALNLRTVIFGGEALDLQTLKPWFERHGDLKPQLINMYGITETTVHVTYKPLSLADLNYPGSNIGKAIPDLLLYVLDPHSQLAPLGVPGELHVGGSGLAEGYLNRPELTAQKFIANPFDTGTRLYKTGDLVRYLDNGDLEYLGRIDNQVKIRGFRIELGEIESQLATHPDIREALVLAQSQNGQPRLLAYYIAHSGKTPNTSELRRVLQEQLPDYMIPAAFIALDTFPLTPSGKIDSRALPSLEQQRPDLDCHYIAPQTALEQTLSKLWQEALAVPQVGVLDNIFDLGAHSILVIQVRNKLQLQLKRDIPAVQLFQYPTIKALADYLSQSPNSGNMTTSNMQTIQDRAVKRQQAQQHRRNVGIVE